MKLKYWNNKYLAFKEAKLKELSKIKDAKEIDKKRINELIIEKNNLFNNLNE